MASLAVTEGLEVARPSSSPIQTVAFSQDGRWMATGDTRRLASVWHDDRLIYELDLTSRHDKVRPTERIRGLAFSPAGDTLYTACGDLLRAFDMISGQEKWMYRPMRHFGFLIVSPIALSVSSSGDIAVATDAGRLSLWTPEGAMRAHWGDNDSPRQIAFVDDDTIAGTDSFSLCTWKMGMSRKLTRKRLGERCYGFSAARAARRVCVRSIHAVEVWDLEADVLVGKHPAPFGPPLVAISADGNDLYIGGTDKIVHIELATSRETSIAVDAPVRSLSLTPDGKRVFAGCADGVVRSWNMD